MDLNDPTTVALLAADAFERAGHQYAIYLEDARAALRRSSEVLDVELLTDELAALAAELQDVDVRGRWASTQKSA